jgi:hypothetical protein
MPAPVDHHRVTGPERHLGDRGAAVRPRVAGLVEHDQLAVEHRVAVGGVGRVPCGDGPSNPTLDALPRPTRQAKGERRNSLLPPC